MINTQEALDTAVRSKLQYQKLVEATKCPIKQMHYNSIAIIFDLASYDIAQLLQQLKEQQ